MAASEDRYGNERAVGGIERWCPCKILRNVVLPALEGPMTAQCSGNIDCAGNENFKSGNIAGFEAASCPTADGNFL